MLSFAGSTKVWRGISSDSFLFAMYSSFVLAFISPLLLIGANTNDFSIRDGGLFLWQLFFAIASVFAVFLLIFWVLHRFWRHADIFVFVTLTVIFFWSLYVPLSIGKLDGIDTIQISYLNLMAGLVIGILAFVCRARRKLILPLLLVGPFVLAIQSLINNVQYSTNSTEILNVSKSNQNVFVISFDSLQSDHVAAVLNSDPELRSAFAGFVNYEEVVGVSPFTQLSVVTTKLGYLPAPMKNTELLGKYDQFITSVLANHHFDVETYAHFGLGEPDSVNVIEKFQIADEKEQFYFQALEGSLLRVAPHPLTVRRIRHWLPGGNGGLGKTGLSSIETHPLLPFKNDIEHFEKFISLLEVGSNAPTFRMHHYLFTHDPITFSADCVYKVISVDRQRVSVPEETSCAIRKMIEFMEKLKHLDVWDNSLIFFISDHGYECGYNQKWSVGKHRVSKRWCLSRYMPFMLLKDFGSVGDMKVSQQQVSLQDVAKTICEATTNDGSCSSYEGYDLLRSVQKNSSRSRQILVARGPVDNRNFEYFNAVDVGRQFSIEKYFGLENNKIILGGKNLLGEVGGLTDMGIRRAITGLDSAGYLVAEQGLGVENGRYRVSITYRFQRDKPSLPESSYWDISYNGGDNIFHRSKFENTGQSTRTDSYEFMTGVTLGRFSVRSYFAGEGELAVHSIVIERLQIDGLGSLREVNFQQPFQASVSGVSAAEKWGSWSIGEVVTLKGTLDEASILQIDVRGFVHSRVPKQQVDVYLNETKLGNVVFKKGEKNRRDHTFEIPTGIIKVARENILKFKISDPTSPKSLGISNDKRTLGIGFYSIGFR